MVSIEEKYIVFNLGYLEDYMKFKKITYFINKFYVEGTLPLNESIEHLMLMYDYFDKFLKLDEHKHYFDCARRIYNARREKCRRLKKKLRYLLSMGECLFCTLTFNDEAFLNLAPKTRRRYVTKFLGIYSKFFVANIDFGEENEREHYHSVILCDFIPAGSFPYGYDYYEKIKVNGEDTVQKVGKYLNKLVNHSVKISTGCSSLIISDYASRIEEFYRLSKRSDILEEIDSQNVLEEIDNIF